MEQPTWPCCAIDIESNSPGLRTMEGYTNQCPDYQVDLNTLNSPTTSTFPSLEANTELMASTSYSQDGSVRGTTPEIPSTWSFSSSKESTIPTTMIPLYWQQWLRDFYHPSLSTDDWPFYVAEPRDLYGPGVKYNSLSRMATVADIQKLPDSSNSTTSRRNYLQSNRNR